MKVEPQSAIQNHASAHVHEPATKAKAHGLVRQLQDDTFNGASAEKLRARFAHRLTESSDASVAGTSTSTVPSTDDAVGDSLIADAAPSVDDGSSIGEPSDGIDGAVVAPTIDTPWYGDANASYVLGGSGQQFDWSV